ncbi:MAG: hypothetical protein IK038_01550 [Bacteroidaceae bacterium]|nr:hypothetical protein [Bacteroidaceae bacterium]
MEHSGDKYDHLLSLIDQIIELEKKSVELNTSLLQEMIDSGERNIDTLDRVADRLLDTMNGFTGGGENEYRQYLDYIETFNPIEARERREDLEYDLGYKTHILYAAAILCHKELEGKQSKDGRPSFDVIMKNYIPKVYDIKKKTASFLFFIHLGTGRPINELIKMLQAITETTDYVLSKVEEYEDLMYYPRETYHPLRDDEWEFIHYIVEHNIELYKTNQEYNRDLMSNVFGVKENN